jgi:hypothetical protein
MLINTDKSLYVGIENPRVTGSIPVQATKTEKPRKLQSLRGFFMRYSFVALLRFALICDCNH